MLKGDIRAKEVSAKLQRYLNHKPLPAIIMRLLKGKATPCDRTLKRVMQVGAAPALSLELFNEKYWAEDPLEVARTGLEKMRAIAEG